MRAGRMKHLIEIQAVETEIDEYGTPVETWATVASLRAELVEQTAEEFVKAQGATGTVALIFRTRHLAGVDLVHRVLHRGEALNIRQVTPIDGERGLEIRCTRPE